MAHTTLTFPETPASTPGIVLLSLFSGSSTEVGKIKSLPEIVYSPYYSPWHNTTKYFYTFWEIREAIMEGLDKKLHPGI